MRSDPSIVSTSEAGLLEEIVKEIENAAERAHFSLNTTKQEGPSACITAFNIILAKGSMEVGAERLKKFEEALAAATNASQRAGIKSYVTSVNPIQGRGLPAE
jgi:hypothetical protein